MSQPPFDPQEFLKRWQAGERPITGPVGGEPSLPAIRARETLEVAEYINAPTEAEPRPSNDGKRLFDVVEMADGKGGSAYGLRRNDGLGRWHPTRYLERERAEAERDALTLAWCEGNESILVEGFKNTLEEEQT